MTEEFRPILNSIDFSSNYVEANDSLYISLTWTGGMRPYNGEAEISVDFKYDKTQRYPENAPGEYRITWTPFPGVSEWKNGMTVFTGGNWKIPEKIWCGPFRVIVSITGDDGRAIPFIGKNGRTVFSEDVGKIDVGWGWGRKMLLLQRHPVSAVINRAQKVSFEKESGTVKIGPLTLSANGPSCPSSPCGIKARITDLGEHTVFNVFSTSGDLKISSPTAEKGKIFYSVTSVYCSFDVIFESVEKDKILLYVGNLKSEKGFALCSVYIPHLFSVGEEGELFNFFGGGRALSVKDGYFTGACFRYDSSCAVACSERSSGVVVTADDMDSILFQSVEMTPEGKRGFIGCELTLLLPSLSDGAHPIPVKESPVAISGIGSGWISFAEYMRARLPKFRPSRYNDAIIYKISADKSFEADENRPETCSNPVSFSMIKSIIERMYNVSGGVRQVVYIVGWQRRGHDTEYPCPHKYGFSPVLGTYDQWLDCLDFAKKHNTVLSFHDNFDDAYNLDGVDPDLIAVDRRGEKRTGWLWAGGMSYIISQKAYNLTGEMADRVAETVKLYRIEDSYHLDVLSAEIRRYDYSEKYCSAAIENLEYKKKIIEEFAGYGIDVTSENVSEPFVGLIEYALHTKYDFSSVLFPGERVIPLTTYMYHGRILYSMSSLNDRDRLMAVAVGAVSGFDCLGPELGEGVKKSLFLHALPMQFLSDREVTECRWDESHAFIGYGENSYVDADFYTGNYTIVADGQLLVSNGLASIPLKTGDGFIVFSDRERDYDPGLGKFSVFELSYDGKGKRHTVERNGENCFVRLKACVPLVIKKES